MQLACLTVMVSFRVVDCIDLTVCCVSTCLVRCCLLPTFVSGPLDIEHFASEPILLLLCLFFFFRFRRLAPDQPLSVLRADQVED